MSAARSTDDVFDAQEIGLSFPARPEFLRLARLTAADAGARAGFSVEDVDNLRIAVDELAYPLASDGCAAEVTMRIRLTPGFVEISAERELGPHEEPPVLGDLARTILDAVIDSYELQRNGSRHGFRLVKRRGGRPADPES